MQKRQLTKNKPLYHEKKKNTEQSRKRREIPEVDKGHNGKVQN